MVNAISQQPTATIPGKMRFWGPDTVGERKRRLALTVFILAAFPLLVGAPGTMREPETLCDAPTLRDCEALVLTGTFLRF